MNQGEAVLHAPTFCGAINLVFTAGPSNEEKNPPAINRMNFPAASSGVSIGNHLNRPKGRGIKPLSASLKNKITYESS